MDDEDAAARAPPARPPGADDEAGDGGPGRAEGLVGGSAAMVRSRSGRAKFPRELSAADVVGRIG